jgi:hypothetical protein
MSNNILCIYMVLIKDITPLWLQNEKKEKKYQTFLIDMNETNYIPFVNRNQEVEEENIDVSLIPDDILTKIYFASLGGLGIYFLYRIMFITKE